MYVFALTLAVMGAVLVYFLPAMIAISRSHLNTTSIILTNLLFGWTVIGWIIALIWAFTDSGSAIKLWKFVLALLLLLAVPVILAVWFTTHRPADRNDAARAPAVRTGVPVPADELLGK